MPPVHAPGGAASAPATDFVVRGRPLVVDESALVSAALLALTAYGLWLARDLVVTLLFAAVLTFLGAPIVRRLEARRVPRAAGAALFILGALLVLAALLALVLPTLVRELVELFRRLPAVFQRVVEWVELTTGRELPRSISDLSGAAAEELVQRLTSLASTGGAAVGKGAVGVVSGAVSALGFVGQAVLVPVLAFFFLVELDATRGFLMLVLPRRARDVVARYAPLIDRALSGMVRGQLTVAAIMAGIYIVGLSIAGVPLAVAIGILAGAGYLIPFASGAICIVLAVAFSLLELGTAAMWPVIGAVITAVVVQLVEGWFLTPRIVGESAGLSPLAAVLAVLFGGALFGFLGVLFALPIAAALGVVVREEIRRRGLSGAAPASRESMA